MKVIQTAVYEGPKGPLSSSYKFEAVLSVLGDSG